MLIRAHERFRSEHNGIVSWHCFSAGAHYDPSRLGFGALLGFDEHVLGPGAGFADHAHRDVEIVSWVAAGALRHVGDGGELIVLPGQVLLQACGEGIRHAERNASQTEPLRLIQTTLAGGPAQSSARVAVAPLSAERGRLSVARRASVRLDPLAFIHVVAGTATVGGTHLRAGDSLACEEHTTLSADGEVLVWSLG